MLGGLVEKESGEFEDERSLDGEEVTEEGGGLVGAQRMQVNAEDAREKSRGVVRGGDDLHDELEGVEDDHAGLGGEYSLNVRIGLGVGDTGQRPPTAAVARSSAAADGGVPAQRERVMPGQGRLEE